MIACKVLTLSAANVALTKLFLNSIVYADAYNSALQCSIIKDSITALSLSKHWVAGILEGPKVISHVNSRGQESFGFRIRTFV